MPNKQLDVTLVSETLRKLGQKPIDGRTKISELMEDFRENGLLLSLIFFSLPIAIPLPYPPGFTTIMAAPLLMLSIQMIVGNNKVNLPSKINNYELKNSTLKSISDKIVPNLIYVEKYVKPRFSFAKSVYCEQFIGLVSLIASISIAVPLPLTNAVPALGISVMAIGLLNRDGLVIIAGIGVTIIGLIMATVMILGSWIGIKYLFNSIF